MPFVKGQSGNPRGRPPGIKQPPNKYRAEIKARTPEILARLFKLGFDGDGDQQILFNLLDRVLPKMKPVDRPVPITEGIGLSGVERSEKILDATIKGRLTPAEGAAMLTALGGHAKVVEGAELQERLQEILARIEKLPDRSREYA